MIWFIFLNILLFEHIIHMRIGFVTISLMVLLIEAHFQSYERHSTSFALYKNSLPIRKTYNCRKYGEPMWPVKPINRTVYFFLVTSLNGFLLLIKVDVKTKTAPVGGSEKEIFFWQKWLFSSRLDLRCMYLSFDSLTLEQKSFEKHAGQFYNTHRFFSLAKFSYIISIFYTLFISFATKPLWTVCTDSSSFPSFSNAFLSRRIVIIIKKIIVERCKYWPKIIELLGKVVEACSTLEANGMLWKVVTYRKDGNTWT